MAYIKPTPTLFKLRFPEFAAVNDDLISLIIDEVEPGIDVSWTESDRAPAIMYLVAHKLAVSGYPGAAGSTAVTGPIKSRHVGDVRVDYAGFSDYRSAGNAKSWYYTTAYGIEYYALLKRNFIGFEIA